MVGAELAGGGMLLNVLAVGVIILFIVTLLLPKKLHYIVNGIILIGLGGVHLLYESYYTEIDISGSPMVRFVIAFVVAATAKELLKECLTEKGAMRAATFIVGSVLIILAVIPEMYHYGAISFDLPELPILFSFFYITGGIVAILAPFFLKE